VFDIGKQKLPTVSMATSSLVSVLYAVAAQEKSGHGEVNLHLCEKNELLDFRLF
jgi:hypothetical protein